MGQKITILGHLVYDYCVATKDYELFRNISKIESIDEILKVCGTNSLTTVIGSPGGPALNWAQYLSLHHDVRVMSIKGNDEQSQELKDLLEDINTKMSIKEISGSLPRFLLFYLDEKINDSWEHGIRWEPGVSTHGFKNFDLDLEALAETDILALPITEPEVGLKAAKEFVKKNPAGKIFYNPGRFLQRRDEYSFEKTNFKRIAQEASWIVLNRDETSIIKRDLGLEFIENLFKTNKRLELIITTLDMEGSIIYERKTDRVYAYEPKKAINADPGQSLGAGDAYSATLLNKLAFGYPIEDALSLASIVAEESLKFVGATNERSLSWKELKGFVTVTTFSSKKLSETQTSKAI